GALGALPWTCRLWSPTRTWTGARFSPEAEAISTTALPARGAWGVSRSPSAISTPMPLARSESRRRRFRTRPSLRPGPAAEGGAQSERIQGMLLHGAVDVDVAPESPRATVPRRHLVHVRRELVGNRRALDLEHVLGVVLAAV